MVTPTSPLLWGNSGERRGATAVGPRAIVLNESPSATPSGSYSAANSNGVTVNIIGIGVGFVGGALCLIALTLTTRLIIARRRAREQGRPLPQLWDVVFDSSATGRAAIGRSLGGWDYGMDIWAARGLGIWGLGSADKEGDALGKRPVMSEIEIGETTLEAVPEDINKWKPTSAFIHSKTIIPEPAAPASDQPALEPQSGSTISTVVLILLPSPDRPCTQQVDRGRRRGRGLDEQLERDRDQGPTTIEDAKGKTFPVHHVEDVDVHPMTSRAGDGQHDNDDDNDEPDDLPDFVLGVLTIQIQDQEVAGDGEQLGTGTNEGVTAGPASVTAVETQNRDTRQGPPSDGLIRNFWTRS